MATFVDRLKIVLDWDGKAAETGSKRFVSNIREAEGASGKLKAGLSSMFQSIKQNAGLFAAAAGAALLAFAGKAVGAFSEVAKAAIDFAKAAGFSVEEASRWIAVADDFQVSAEGISSATARISRDLDAEKWTKYGIATRDAGGAARSTNDIFLDSLDVLGRITNKTEQSHAAFELFGRGWQSMAPLIGKTREEYEEMLGSVEDGLVVTNDEAEAAENWRLALDDLSDALLSVEIAFGGVIAKAAPYIKGVTATINGLQWAWKTANSIGDAEGLGYGDANKAVTKYWDTIRNLNDSRLEGIDTSKKFFEALVAGRITIDDLNTIIDDHNRLLAQAVVQYALLHPEIDAVTESAERHGQAIARAGDMYPDTRAEIIGAEADLGLLNNAMLASIDSNFALADANDRFKQALDDLATAVDDPKTSVDEYDVALRNTEQSAMAVAAAEVRKAEDMAEANGKVLSAKEKHDLYITALQKTADQMAPGSALRRDLDAYITMLGRIPANINTRLTVTTNRQGSTVGGGSFQVDDDTGQAAGGDVRAGTGSWVGEHGKEWVEFRTDAHVYPHGVMPPDSATSGVSESPSGSSSSPVVNVTINAGMGTDGPAVARLVADAVTKAWRDGYRGPWMKD